MESYENGIKTSTAHGQNGDVLPATLCERCLEFKAIKEDYDSNNYHDYEPNSTVVFRSDLFRPLSLSLRTCGVCRVIVEAAVKTGVGRLDDQWCLCLFYNGDVCIGPTRVSIKGIHAYPDCYFFIHSSPHLPCPWALFPQLTHLSNAALDMVLPTLDAISIWTQDCFSNHGSGCSSTGETRLPNRVLAIRKSPNDIRLFESKNCTGRYACLSHCWGEQQLLKTTKHNLEAHLKSISWDTIPKTFQDAIRVAWHLDLEYLWIDSLCIIQDDANDWVRESNVMCDIYENSYITLAATSALNSSVGLFLKDHGVSVEISGSVSPDTNFKLIIRRDHDHPSPYGTDIWPLFRRAWVLQERLLSPRVIHFNEQELVWECRQLTKCQCGGSHELGKKEHYQTVSRPTPANLIQTWHNIVERFCPLKATFESDKLPALSGLARQMARLRPQARYLAGLWSDSLETDLLWHNYDSIYCLDLRSYSNSKPRRWRAPSWSWASTDAKVVHPLSDYYIGSEYRGEILHLYSTVSDAQTELATKDATGQVKGGSIQIRGPIFEARSVGTRVGAPESSDSLSIVIEGKGQNLSSCFGKDDKILFDFPADPFRNDMGVPASQRQIKCVRMARIRRGYRGPWAATSVEEVEYGIVVQRLSPSTFYQRIGMALICRESEKEKDLQQPEGMWEERLSCFEKGGAIETITIF